VAFVGTGTTFSTSSFSDKLYITGLTEVKTYRIGLNYAMNAGSSSESATVWLNIVVTNPNNQTIDRVACSLEGAAEAYQNRATNGTLGTCYAEKCLDGYGLRYTNSTGTVCAKIYPEVCQAPSTVNWANAKYPDVTCQGSYSGPSTLTGSVEIQNTKPGMTGKITIYCYQSSEFKPPVVVQSAESCARKSCYFPATAGTSLNWTAATAGTACTAPVLTASGAVSDGYYGHGDSITLQDTTSPATGTGVFRCNGDTGAMEYQSSESTCNNVTN
jgi:hypothetical protein